MSMQCILSRGWVGFIHLWPVLREKEERRKGGRHWILNIDRLG